MDTSGSDEAWLCGVAVFSGRPDRTWRVTAATAARLEALWESLPSLRQAAAPQTLGYRGSYLKHSRGRTWHAWRGIVSLSDARSSKSRRDPDRNFEISILESAPEGLIPLELLDGEIRERLTKKRQ